MVNIWLVESEAGDERPSLGLARFSTLYRKKGDNIIHLVLRSGYKIPNIKPDKVIISIIFSWEIPFFVDFIRVLQFRYTHLKIEDIEIGGVAPFYMRDFIKEQTGIEPIKGCVPVLDVIPPDPLFYEAFYRRQARLYADRSTKSAEKARVKANKLQTEEAQGKAQKAERLASEARTKAERMESGDIRAVDLQTFVFTTRGCKNGCTYCVVPDIEGREMAVITGWLNHVNLRAKEIVVCDNNILAAPKAHKEEVFAFLAEVANVKGTIIPDSNQTKRVVTFDGGFDFRRINSENMELIKQVKWNKIRMAWDNVKDEKLFDKAIRMMLDVYGKGDKLIREFEVYVLYNFYGGEDKYDTIEDTLYRIYKLRNYYKVYPYAMRYQPLTRLDYKEYLSPKWNKHDAGDIARWVNSRWIFEKVKNYMYFAGRDADGKNIGMFDPTMEKAVEELRQVPSRVDFTKSYQENFAILKKEMEERSEIMKRIYDQVEQLKLAI